MMYSKKGQYYAALALIVILAFVFRVLENDEIPHGFFCDEADIGNNAYSLATTGKSVHGSSFPVFFTGLNDGKNPVMIYTAIPFVALGGLNEASVRTTAAFYGVLGIIAIFYLAASLFRIEIGLLAALMLAVSPWHFHFSRIGFETIASVTWITASMLFLQLSLKNIRYLWLAAFSLIAAFFSYTAPKLYIAPLLLAFLIINIRDTKHWLKQFYFWRIAIVSILILTLMVYFALQNSYFFSRWHQVYQETTPVLNYMKSYVNHFSLDFLFLTGEIDFEGQYLKRHSVSGVGQLYLFQLPFILFGIVFGLRKYRKETLFVIALTILYPLGTIFTDVKPQACRSLVGMIPFQIFTASGIYFFVMLIRRPAIRIAAIIVCVSLFVASVGHFAKAYAKYPEYSSGYYGWQSGYVEMLQLFREKYDEYDQFLITHRFNEGDALLRFYQTEYPCDKCKVMHNPIIIDSEKRQLFALRDDDIEEAGKLYPDQRFHETDQYRLPDGEVELRIGYFISARDQ